MNTNFLKTVKIGFIIISFIFLTGFLPILSFIGPGLTIMSSGSVYKASAQYAINETIKKKTGKNSLDFLSDKINNQDENINLKSLGVFLYPFFSFLLFGF